MAMGENIFNLPLRSKDDYIVNMLSSYKIDTIEKVTQFGTKELYDYIRKLDENMSEESLKDGIRYLIFQIHLLGYLFVGEDSSILGKNAALAPKSLKILSLSDKTYHCLKKAGIHTVGQLLSCDKSSLFRFKGFGEKQLDEVREKVHYFGGSFIDDYVQQNDDLENITLDQVKNLEDENERLRQLILKKENLVVEYQRLQLERKNLLERERQLDLELEKLSSFSCKKSLIKSKKSND